jgi:hypothetical protein
MPSRPAGVIDLAAVLKRQSEIEACDPDLFVQAGKIAGELADAEERFFSEVRSS